MIMRGAARPGEGGADLREPDADEMQGGLPAAPKYDALKPLAAKRATRVGAETSSFSVTLKVVTPILGGAAVTRTIDEVDVIRVPTVRGHLRFWWRALYGHEYATPQELHEAESWLWGRAAKEDGDGGRSAVDIQTFCNPDSRGTKDDTNDFPPDQFYALWPAAEQNARPNRPYVPPAPRRLPGTTFTLKLTGSKSCEHVLRNVVRAWILFGGYGSRTRRGLGNLTVVENPGDWLPTAATREELTRLFGRDVFTVLPGSSPVEAPRLAGASLMVGTPVIGNNAAERAWTTALDWLKEFRQGTNGGVGNRAREPDPAPNPRRPRPSVSNWPEAGKVRRFSLNQPKSPSKWAHAPSRNGVAAYPRGGFGLPVIGQFQKLSREDRPGWKKGDKKPRYLFWNELPVAHPNYGREPDDVEYRLRWRSGPGPNQFDEHDRLASPLIVKALPLSGDRFVPCALWLDRELPSDARIGLEEDDPGRPGKKRVRAAYAAPFDRLEDAPGSALFAPLRNKPNLRQAFLDWLGGRPQVTWVAP